MAVETWLAAELTLADGRVRRFGPDEAADDALPSDISWSTQVPGGFDVGSITLPRCDLCNDDAQLFASVRMYGQGGRVAYEGRVTGIPQVGTSQIHLELEGWITHLADNEFFRRLYLDSDLNNWHEASVARQLTLIALSAKPVSGGGVTPDLTTGDPSLATTVEGAWPAATRNEQWYVGTLPIGALYYAWKNGNPTLITSPFTNLTWQVEIGSGDVTTAQNTGNLAAAGPGSGTLTATGERTSAMVMLSLTGSGGADQDQRTIYWTSLVPIGPHGLPIYDLPDGAPGLLGSDILRDAVAIGAPLLNMTTDSVEGSSNLISHLKFEGTTVREVVEQVTKLGASYDFLPDWGVYDDRTFFWRSPGTYGRTWRVKREELAVFTDEGPAASERVSGVVVTYQDSAGTNHSIGPPGSGADTETTDLADTDTANPATKIGKVKVQDIGVSYENAAKLIGQLILSEQNRQTRRGQLTVAQTVTDETGATYPAWMVRAGDRVYIQEDAQPEPMTIANTSYSHDSLTVSADVGAPANSSEVLLSQLAA